MLMFGLGMFVGLCLKSADKGNRSIIKQIYTTALDSKQPSMMYNNNDAVSHEADVLHIIIANFIYTEGYEYC